MSDTRREARKIAQEYIGKGDFTGWFEPIYSAAQGDVENLIWGDQEVSPYFLEWEGRPKLAGTGKRAMVTGCGLGDDAEEVARLGLRVVAFDISPTAIEWCRRRFPNSPVEYRVADLLAPPQEWTAAFDFVLEISTLQTLPLDLRRRCVEHMARFLAPGGTLLALARRRDPGQDLGTAPWTMLKEDLDHFVRLGLREVSFEEIPDRDDPSVRRFRALYRREVPR